MSWESVVSVLALIVSVMAAGFAHRANKIAREANKIANSALAIEQDRRIDETRPTLVVKVAAGMRGRDHLPVKVRHDSGPDLARLVIRSPNARLRFSRSEDGDLSESVELPPLTGGQTATVYVTWTGATGGRVELRGDLHGTSAGETWLNQHLAFIRSDGRPA